MPSHKNKRVVVVSSRHTIIADVVKGHKGQPLTQVPIKSMKVGKKIRIPDSEYIKKIKIQTAENSRKGCSRE